MTGQCSKCHCPWRWWGVVTVLLCVVPEFGLNQYAPRNYQQERQSRQYRSGVASRVVTTSSSPINSAAVVPSYSGRPTTAGPSEKMAPNQYLSRLFNSNLRSWSDQSRQDAGTPSLPLRSLSSLPRGRTSAGGSGSTAAKDRLPKSQLKGETADEDYTGFRQQFLRELCSRLPQGPISDRFSAFCFSLRSS